MPDTDDEGVDVLSISREEAHRTVDSQVRTLESIDTKAAKTIRLNLVLLGIILTGLSLATAPETAPDGPVYYSDLVNVYTITGTGLLLGSTAVAAVTYTSSSLRVGVGPTDLRSFLDNDYSDRANLEGLVEGYAEWIEYNYEINAKNAPLGTLTVLLLLVAMASLALGVKQAATGRVEWWLLAGTVGLLLLVVYLTGFLVQVRRYWRIRSN